MRNSEASHKRQVNMFHSGATPDLSPEIHSFKEGIYYDARNMRNSDAEGFDKILSKINGDIQLWGKTNPNYVCIGACYVNHHAVSFHVPNNNGASFDTIIIVDGIEMCRTSKIKFQSNFPLQIAVNDSDINSEIFPTDFNIKPIILNLNSIISNYNSGSLIYFDPLFNLSLYSVQLTFSLNMPKFVGLISRMGVGLYVGKYSYSIRYVDSLGNRTAISTETPYIPVVWNNNDSECSTYPATGVYGAEPDINPSTGKSNYGIHLKIRVNNPANYSYIEVRRIAQNVGQQQLFIASAESYKITHDDITGNVVDILGNPNQIINFIDDSLKLWTSISDEEDSIEPSGFAKAKSVRYYENRLFYGNIEEGNKDLTGKVTFKKSTNGNYGCALIEGIGEKGHKLIYNQVYKPNFQSGEIYGWGVYFKDELGARSFVLPIENFIGDSDSMRNFRMPDRRTEIVIGSDEYNASYLKSKTKPVTCINEDNINSLTFERVKLGIDGHIGRAKPENPPSNVKRIKAGLGLYNPLTPKFNDKIQGTDTLIDLEYNLQHWVVGDGTSMMTNSHKYYQPHGFAPEYYTQGMSFEGIDNDINGNLMCPEWAKSFNIVRTKPANRVIAQGLAMYSMVSGSEESDGVNDETPASKNSKKMWCYFPDIDNALASTSSIANLVVQLVAPFGFFTEVLTGDNSNYNTVLSGTHTGIDMITYARIMSEKSAHEINGMPQDFDRATGQHGSYDYDIKFGEFLDTDTSLPPSSNPSYPKHTYNILSATPISGFGTGRGKFELYEIEIAEDLYNSDELCSEPFYVVNIISLDAETPQDNINEYIETGHQQLLSSIIGKGTGSPMILPLVDERFEDCIPNPYTFAIFNPISSENRYIEVNKKKWINITYFDTNTKNQIYSDLNNNGVYIDSDGINCFGVYTNDNVQHISNDFSIYFNFIIGLNNQYCIPAKDVFIEVLYDNRIPIKLFAGDTAIGENIFCPIDAKTPTASGTSRNNQNQFFIGVSGFPYWAHELFSEYEIMTSSTASGGNHIQNSNFIKLEWIRQLVVMFSCEAKTNLPITFNYSVASGFTENQYFPLVNYIMRPQIFTNQATDVFDAPLGTGNVNAQYQTDYPDEYYYGWEYGGFKFGQFNNQDYSKSLNDRNNTSMPLLGFVVVSKYPTRVIWSELRNINEQDDPNLKTFLSTSLTDLADNKQEIKFLWDCDSGKGNNLIAITGLGMCLLLTDKTQLVDSVGGQLSMVQNPNDKLIQGQIWITKTVGCIDEFWRGIAEFNNKLFIPTNTGIYMLNGLELRDILRNDKASYFSKLSTVLKSVKSEYATPMCAAYDVRNKEYLLYIGNTIIYQTTDKNVRPPYVFRLDEMDPSNPHYNIVNEDILYLTTIRQNELIVLSWNISIGQYFILKNNGNYPFLIQGADLSTQTILPGQTVKAARTSNVGFGWTITAYILKHNTYSYNDAESKGFWNGVHGYFGEKMISVSKISNPVATTNYNDSSVLAIRNMTTFQLDRGFQIDGTDIDAWVTFIVSPANYIGKELIYISIASSSIPNYAEFGSDDIANLGSAITDYFKNYNTWYTLVPRQVVSGVRVQGRSFFVKVGHNEKGDWVLNNVESQFKFLK